MGHSDRHSDLCSDPKTYWERSTSTCVLCAVKPGYRITTNCGFDDEGGQHELPHIECEANATFNDGSSAYCQPCAACARGFAVSSPCTTTSNSKCQDPGSEAATADSLAETTSSHYASSVFSTITQGSSLKPNAATIVIPLNPAAAHNVGILWAIPFAILMSIVLVVICARLIGLRRKRGQHTVWSYRRRSSYINAGFSPRAAPRGTKDLEHILGPDILAAPLQTVLDNLDVLEELVILLDPENQGVKNTKHLASHCSFPATWITYTYSMKDSRSPLKALLEGVTSKHPDWTVGRLAKMLQHMERNDAIAVLTKLELNVMHV